MLLITRYLLRRGNTVTHSMCNIVQNAAFWEWLFAMLPSACGTVWEQGLKMRHIFIKDSLREEITDKHTLCRPIKKSRCCRGCWRKRRAWLRGGGGEEGATIGCHSCFCTALVPPALREDTRWLPQQLHLALLILQFSPQERMGGVEWKEAVKKKRKKKNRVREKKGFHFSCRSKVLKECHIWQKLCECVSEHKCPQTHSHTHRICVQSF